MARKFGDEMRIPRIWSCGSSCVLLGGEDDIRKVIHDAVQMDRKRARCCRNAVGQARYRLHPKRVESSSGSSPGNAIARERPISRRLLCRHDFQTIPPLWGSPLTSHIGYAVRAAVG